MILLMANGVLCSMGMIIILMSHLSVSVSTYLRTKAKYQRISLLVLAGFIELDVSSNMQTIRVPKGGLAKGEDAFRKFPESWMNHGSFLYKRF